MILSFHPCYEADTNIICAGRDPNANDLSAIRAADAVILPQGCREALYRMARNNCPHVFPNYDARFAYPGKTGQARLFQQLDVPHPRTWVFDDTTHFQDRGSMVTEANFPLVLKLDWGGEGDTVFLLQSRDHLAHALAAAADFERTGQRGFVVQRFVPHAHRSLRVVVIGRKLRAYWRVQDTSVFGTSLAKGAYLDADSDPELRREALKTAHGFCQRSRINLAGFDFIFEEPGPSQQVPLPLFLEINFFFGRTGLGGSERFYTLLREAIGGWLDSLGLSVKRPLMSSTTRERP